MNSGATLQSADEHHDCLAAVESDFRRLGRRSADKLKQNLTSSDLVKFLLNMFDI